MRALNAATIGFVLTIVSAQGVHAQVAQSNPSTSSGPVPRVINITGVFQPVDGQPLRSLETVTLAIYTDQTGGAPLWQETQNVVIDTKGRYAMLVGAASAEGIPETVLAAGAQWLGTTFNRQGEVEGPRVQLTSVPYALRAADADTLGGRPASAYLLAPSGATTKGATSSATDTAQSKSAQSNATTEAIQTGTTNMVAKYVNTTDVGNSAIFESGGLVGINTTAPTDALHVRFTNTGGSMTGLAVQNMGNTVNSYSGTLFYDQNGVLGQFQGFNNVTHEYRINNIATSGSINFMLNSASKFLVAPNGNIGIGTTSPSAILDVSNAAIPAAGAASFFETSYGANGLGSAMIGRKARGTGAAPSATLAGDLLTFWGGNGYGTTGFGNGNTGIIIQATENFTDAAQGTQMVLSTTPNGANLPLARMSVKSNGTIGMGTQSPNAGLEVSNADNGLGAGTMMTTTFTNAGSSQYAGRRARGTGIAPTAVQNGDALVSFVGEGYGTTGFSNLPRGGMFVRAAENWTDTAQGTALDFNTTNLGTSTANTRMTIDPFGDVGIGTTTPNGALELSRTGGDTSLQLTTYASANSNANPEFRTLFANGTPAAPTAVQSGNILGLWIAGGYGATQFNDVNGGMGVIAQENWTNTAQGAATVFLATPLGSSLPHVYTAILPSGNVGIGDWTLPTPVPTAADKLQVFGDIRVGTTGTNGCLKNFAGTGIAGTCASDRRFKKNITPFGSVLDRVTLLRPVHFDWRTTEFPDRHFGDSRSYGLIAQDVEDVLPELVVTGEDGFKAVDYSKLPLLTIQAVKELKQRVADLERIIQEMRATMPRR